MQKTSSISSPSWLGRRGKGQKAERRITVNPGTHTHCRRDKTEMIYCTYRYSTNTSILFKFFSSVNQKHPFLRIKKKQPFSQQDWPLQTQQALFSIVVVVDPEWFLPESDPTLHTTRSSDTRLVPVVSSDHNKTKESLIWHFKPLCEKFVHFLKETMHKLYREGIRGSKFDLAENFRIQINSIALNTRYWYGNAYPRTKNKFCLDQFKLNGPVPCPYKKLSLPLNGRKVPLPCVR